MSDLYEQDFNLWVEETKKAIQNRDFENMDWDNLSLITHYSLIAPQQNCSNPLETLGHLLAESEIPVHLPGAA
jgi:Domain of unknown function DUF29